MNYRLPMCAPSGPGWRWLAAAATGIALSLQSQTADSFNPGGGASVSVVALQADGKILVGANGLIGGQAVSGLARLAPDGTAEASFNPGQGTVNCLAVQPDGKILVGGDFDALGGHACTNLGRINPDGTLDSSFNASANNAVFALGLQPDGKVLVGGLFTSLCGTARSRLGRLNVDGTPDNAFPAEADYRVYALAVQADGKILVGGSFTNLAGVARNSLGRLNSDGSLDSAFMPGGSGLVRGLLVQSDDRILVTGSFTNVGGVVRSNLARLNANGTLDSTFNPGANKIVNTACLQTDGRILVGGQFTTLAGATRNYIGRLYANGTLDPTFNPGAGSTVLTMAVQPDGKVLVGGIFTSLAGASRTSLGRLLNTAPATQSLTLGPPGATWLRDGAGPEIWRATFEFSTNGADWTGAGAGVRISGGWQLSAAWPARCSVRARGFVGSAGFGNSTWSLESLAGAPFITGQPASQEQLPGSAATFTVTAGGDSPLGYQWRKNGTNLSNSTTSALTLNNVTSTSAGGYSVVVTNNSGSVTSIVAAFTVLSFVTGTGVELNSGSIYATAFQADGKALVGGSFGGLGGTDVSTLGRLNTDLSVDAAFATNSKPNGPVYCLAVQPDGKLLIGGNFSMMGNTSRNSLGRLNADGTLDSAFKPGGGGTVYSLAVQPDGRILVGGSFVTLGGQTRNNLGRLNSDGSLDTTFLGTASNIVYCVALQADRKILVAGAFTGLAGQACANLGRLNLDGTLDAGFTPNANSTVYCLAVQPDTRIVAGGTFSTIGGRYSPWLVRLNANGYADPTFNATPNAAVNTLALQADGKVLVGGSFTTLLGQTQYRVGRLNSDGTLDANFNAGCSHAVCSLAVQADGNLLLGAAYTLTRLTNTSGAPQALTFDNASVTWQRGGTSPQVWRVSFEVLTNATDWVSLGDGQLIPGGWQSPVSGLKADAGVRARGYVTGGNYNGSGWFVEAITAPLTLTTQPASRTNNAGTAATFAVTAMGRPPLRYQWLRNGTNLANGGNISGAQTPTLVVGNVLAQDIGGYSAIVNDASGSLTSLVATLTVVDPVLTSQPASCSRNAGTTAAFSVGAAGTPPRSYRWFKDGALVTDGGHFSGANTATLTLSNLLASDAGGYFATVSNVFCTLTSSVATLTVYDPAILVQPTNTVADAGQTATFNLLAAGTPPLTFQWYKSGAPIAGATTNSLTLANVSAADDANYWCVVTNRLGTAVSAAALLRVNLATLDPFNPGPNGSVSSVAVQTDGRILVGGDFTYAGGQTQNHVCRLRPDGSLDSAFVGTADAEVAFVGVQLDGRILVGGGFTNLDGWQYSFLGRLQPDGSLDTSFHPAPDNWLNALALQPDGGFVVGGWFTHIGSQLRGRLARFRADGTLDSTFNPRADQAVRCLALQPDGKILAGGYFTNLCGQPRSGVGRLNADGTLDTTFNPVLTIGSATPWVESIAVQPDGKILLGGHFTSVNGVTRYYVARLAPDGTLDADFNPGCNAGYYTDEVFSFALQADGKIVLAGGFVQLAGAPRVGIGRLNADGSVDPAFISGIDSSIASCFFANTSAVQPDGGVLVGGFFTALDGQTRYNLGRLNRTAPPAEYLTCDGSRILWLRAGPCPELWWTTFEASSDGINWTNLGPGVRISGGWRLSGVSLPPNTALRARGLPAGAGNGSSWFVEAKTQVLSQTRPAVLSDDGGLGLRTNQFGFNVQALPGQAVVIEATTNFISWVPLQTNLTPTLGQIIFSDAQTGRFTRRFYRAKLHPGALPPPAIQSGGGTLGFQAGRFGFNVAGIAGQSVIIETSSDLVNWTGLTTNTLGPGPLYFSDPGSVGRPCRFYRARLQ